MDRRNFVKNTATAGLIAATLPGFLAHAAASEPMTPMGRPLGPDETLLVYNAKPVDVVMGKLLPQSAILVKGDKIRSLPDGFIDIRKADRKIDAGGRFIIPGLINSHCHMTLPGVAALSIHLLTRLDDQIDRNCADCVIHGVTTVRDQLGGQQSLMKRQARIARGELLGPRIMRGIGVQVPDGYGTFIPNFIAKDSVMLARNVPETRDAVKKAVDLGADHIKLFLQYRTLFQGDKKYPVMTDAMLAAAVEEAEKLSKPAAVHETSIKGYRAALKAGVNSLEHAVRDEFMTDEDVKKFIDGGHYSVPTMSVAWALAYPVSGDENFENPRVQEIYRHKTENINEMMDEFLLPRLAKLGKKVHRKYSRPGYFDKDHLLLTPNASFFNAAGAVGAENIMKLYEAGAKFGCGNDGGIPFDWPGNMALEMWLNQFVGMKPADVLRSATIINAENLKLGDSLGSIEENKTADLVFLDGNPLDDIANVAKVEAVLQSGRLTYTKGKVAESRC